MNRRFSMLPGGGLHQRYQWVRFRRAVAAFDGAMREIGRAAEEASVQIAKIVEVWPS